MLHFRQWGYYRSGTNAVRATLAANFDCSITSTPKDHGKHRLFANPGQNEINVVSVRNPWANIRSWSRRKNVTFERGLKNYLPEYIDLNNSWLDGVEKHGGVVVAQEQLSWMPTSILAKIAEYEKPKRLNYWMVPSRRMGISRDGEPLVFQKGYHFAPIVAKRPSLGDECDELLERLRKHIHPVVFEYHYTLK
jgi:hypothetical protein